MVGLFLFTEMILMKLLREIGGRSCLLLTLDINSSVPGEKVRFVGWQLKEWCR